MRTIATLEALLSATRLPGKTMLDVLSKPVFYRANGGVDKTFSLDPTEMAQLVLETEHAWQALGQVNYGPTEAEKPSVQFRRSLYVVQDLKPGDVLTCENVRAIRPGLGLPTKYLEQVLGKTVKQVVQRGTALSFDHLG